ncbi:protein TolQ [Permianibacter aggregans]|uniref:Tol-Pal system protein TolQ n=2 Tax=Permianibacter aggregans TaxID=1510150 RepID=A0A4R6UM47_9GAMM|nr:protein TolQ [Permianibacter aggregans]TDQ48148.1 cell division and transport-associated protein TolQ [Permianibacter aggregans]
MTHDMSFIGLFLNASLFVQLIMVFLLFLSVASWTIIIQRQRVLGKARQEMEQFEEKFWSGVDLNKLYTDLSSRNKENAGLELFFTTGFREFARLRAQTSTSPQAVMDGTHRAMKVAHSREVDKLEHHLSWLATIGSTSPYIGLLGTVWGIMNSFIALGSVKQATLSMVAPGIAEALIATAIGLFAAIPAVIFYNRFNHIVQKLETHYENFIDEFSGILHRKAHSAQTRE